jgi:hypothetical protein
MKRSLSLMILIVILSTTSLASAAVAAPESAINVTQTLPIKDDQGKNLILRNAKEYRMKWTIADPSLYQHFKAYKANNNLLYFVAFDYLMKVDLNGKTLWKQSYPNSLNTITTFGLDDTFYKFYEGNRNYEDETSLRIEGIVRINANGEKTLFPPLSVYAPKDEQGFSAQYPLYSGDAKGNLILLTNKGLTSYKPDGSIGWQQDTISYQGSQLNAFDISNLFSDAIGNHYLQSGDQLYFMDDTGTVKWKTQVEPRNYYLNRNDQLSSWAYNPKTNKIDSKTYSLTGEGKITPITDSAVIYKATNNFIDSRGGIYDLNDETDTVQDYDYKTSNVKWHYGLSKAEIRWGRSLAKFTMTTDDTGNVYFSANVGTVYSLDANGKPRYILTMNNRHSFYSRILAVSDKLTIIMIDNRIICVEKYK